jgi:2,4-dienoyl-CoA reductase-like NADH-dependent reductase (Old Yellow Enzyme family)
VAVERYPHLFEPIQVGSVIIPNRIVRSAVST